MSKSGSSRTVVKASKKSANKASIPVAGRPKASATSCFVLLPSGRPFGYQGGADESNFIFDEIITPVVRDVLRITPQREDRKGSPGDIVASIISALDDSHIVIADLTGVNPNVYWELGVRHALRSFPVILMIQENPGHPLDLPFDISKERTVTYSPWRRAKAQSDLKRALTESLSMTESLLSPVHRVRGPIEAYTSNFAQQFSGKFSDVEWRAIENAIRVELLIKSGKCRDIPSERLHIALTDCLNSSDRSIHVMRVTSDAAESFYSHEDRGDEWIKAQEQWVASHGDKELIRRIVFIESADGKFGELAWNCLQSMDPWCEVRVCRSDWIKIEADRHFASWDFGVFRGEDESHTIFTFSSILRGVIYAKHTSGEFYTSDPDVAEHFARQFDLIWDKEGFLEESERVKAALREKAERKL